MKCCNTQKASEFRLDAYNSKGYDIRYSRDPPDYRNVILVGKFARQLLRSVEVE